MTTTETPTATTGPVRDGNRRAHVVRLTLRVVAALAAADGIVQAMLAGRFLAGNYDALGQHASNAVILVAATIVLLLTATADHWLTRGPWWPIAAAIDMAPSERFDTIVDLTGLRSGDEITVVNDLGTGTTIPILKLRVTHTAPDDSRVPDRLATIEPINPGQAVSAAATSTSGWVRWRVWTAEI